MCLSKLGITGDEEILNSSSKALRTLLREKEFINWTSLTHKGRGVTLFRHYPPANNILDGNVGLTLSELKDAIKMIGDVAPVRAIPGRSKDGTQCRHCSTAENFITETLPHVLGSCPFGELLRNQRHHIIRKMVADALRERDFTVYEEVVCSASSGSIRRVDILSINTKKKEGWIIDPTVRFEMNDDQPSEVHKEKRRIYEPTIPFFKESYGLNEVKVIGLMVGARGTITSEFRDFCSKFGISSPSKFCKSIASITLKKSIQILRHHLYKIS